MGVAKPLPGGTPLLWSQGSTNYIVEQGFHCSRMRSGIENGLFCLEIFLGLEPFSIPSMLRCRRVKDNRQSLCEDAVEVAILALSRTSGIY